MTRILITEQIAESGIEVMRAAGHEVDVQLGLSPEELLAAVPGAAALVTRSATKVTAAVLEAGTDLVVVGRAGSGLDNIDVAAATAHAIMVVNAPEANSVSAAEHTMALLLAQARNLPQAYAALRAGRWERSAWEGVEICGTTLGIVGLGRIGGLVAQRALAFGMRVIAHDPYVSPEQARSMGVELVALAELVAEADFLTIHLPRTPETAGLVGRELLASAKPGLRIVNAARGGIVDEEALADAIESGRIGGAAFDVFAHEPCVDSPLFELRTFIATPHLGASTRQAQDKASETIARLVLLALRGDFVPSAVNVSAATATDSVRPLLPPAERLGQVFAGLNGGVPDRLDVEYQVALGNDDIHLLTLSVLKGLLGAGTDERVSYVNVARLASERGLEVRATQTARPRDHVSLVTLRSLTHALTGALAPVSAMPLLAMVDGYDIEAPTAPHMLIVRHDKRAGMISAIGAAIEGAGMSMSNIAVGRPTDPLAGSEGTALMVISSDDVATQDAFATFGKVPGVLDILMVSAT